MSKSGFKLAFKSPLHRKAAAMALLGITLLIGFLAPRVVYAAAKPNSSAAQANPAQEAWQKEFEDLCSRTQDAMTFSAAELTVLVQRCDALLPQIEQLDPTRKKIYMGRLRMCRGLYAYLLDSKNNQQK
jgi:hypothetical protein